MNTKKNNIVLIGMPGAGKSTAGVILAKLLGFQFLDADLVIQEQQKSLLKDIIKEKGLDGFIEIENRVNAEIQVERTVIATGGSVIYGKQAMEHLCNIGIVIYFRLNYESIESRLGDIRQRGVVLKNGQNLKMLYNERCPLYEKYAHIIINCENLDVEQLVEEVIEQIELIVSVDFSTRK